MHQVRVNRKKLIACAPFGHMKLLFNARGLERVRRTGVSITKLCSRHGVTQAIDRIHDPHRVRG